jgi:hypothetical protein
MTGIDLTTNRGVRASLPGTWTFIAEAFFANHPRWDPAIVELRQLTEGPMGAGIRGVEVRSFGGRQAAEFVVTAYEPHKRFVFRNLTGPFELERSYDFLAAGAGTAIEFRFRMMPKGPLRLLFPLLRRTIEGQVEANISRLAGLLDAGGS